MFRLTQIYLLNIFRRLRRQYDEHYYYQACHCIIGFIVGFTVIAFLKYNGQEISCGDEIILPIRDVGDSPTRNLDPHLVINGSLADYLHQEVRVLCFVSTAPKYHHKRAYHVKATWGKRCNILLFMSSQKDDFLQTVVLPMAKDHYDYLWHKTKESLKYVYRNYYDKADWFLKTDDDTYVIMENLRYFLYTANTSEPIYYGCRFSLPFMNIEWDFMSGGAGYVLSKEALWRVVEKGLPNNDICSSKSYGAEDVELGKCLQDLGVRLGDVRDMEGRARFLPAIYDLHVIPREMRNDTWLFRSYHFPLEPGLGCCSDFAITFHYVKPQKMYALDYLVYRLRPFGIDFNPVLPSRHLV